MKKVSSVLFACVTVALVVILAVTPMFSAFAAEDHNVMLNETNPDGRQHVVLYNESFEPVEGTTIKSPVRAEVGKSKVVSELPGGREGSGVQVSMVFDKLMVGIQPKGIGSVLFPYGDFQPGDTFHFKTDVYLDVDNPQEFYPFVLLCISGNAHSREEKEFNYDEWYPKEGNGTAKNLSGVTTIQPRTWTTIEYEFTVKNNDSDKGRNISFYTDAGAFYLYFGAQVLNKDIYLDNILIEMDTLADPNSRTLPTTATKATEKEPTIATKPTTQPTVLPTVQPTEPAVLAGDANGDGAVNMKDVLAMRKFIANMAPADFDEKAADVNGDGNVNMKDVLSVRKSLAGIAG